MTRTALCTFVTMAVLLLPIGSAAQGAQATFTLDSFSRISFGDREFLFAESGATIVFHFEAPAADGSVAFTIQPGDVSIPPMELDDGGTIAYSLVAPVSGTLTPDTDGRRVEFTATIRATLSGPNGSGSFDYTIPFTTETASAPSADGSESISISGARVIEPVHYGQIVGAVTNEENAFPEPGAPVYAVLSGIFDQLP